MVGLWEFLGGKVEAGEVVTDALCHELDEELGIHPLSWEPLISIEHAYPENVLRKCRYSPYFLTTRL